MENVYDKGEISTTPADLSIIVVLARNISRDCKQR